MRRQAGLLQVVFRSDILRILRLDHQGILLSIVNVREINALFSFFRRVHAGDDHIDLACGQCRNQAVEVHIYDLQLDPQFIRDGLGDIDVETDDFVLSVLHKVPLIRGIISTSSDDQFAAVLDFLQGAAAPIRRSAIRCSARVSACRQSQEAHRSQNHSHKPFFQS